MSTEYERVVIEYDARNRMSIACEDAEGYGHGYRLAGPKFAGDTAKVKTRVVLDKRDVEEIRIYLRIWDEIQACKATESAEASR